MRIYHISIQKRLIYFSDLFAHVVRREKTDTSTLAYYCLLWLTFDHSWRHSAQKLWSHASGVPISCVVNFKRHIGHLSDWPSLSDDESNPAAIYTWKQSIGFTSITNGRERIWNIKLLHTGVYSELFKLLCIFALAIHCYWKYGSLYKKKLHRHFIPTICNVLHYI